MGESPRKVRSVGESVKQTLVLGYDLQISQIHEHFQRSKDRVGGLKPRERPQPRSGDR